MSNADYTRHPAETGGSDALVRLALDLRWTWDHATDELWKQLDPELWDRTHNPWAVLQSASAEKLRVLAEDKFAQRLIAKLLKQQAAPNRAKWFRKCFRNPPLSGIAYFSMEYMLSEALPIYSGGLGNVAGDQLKAADDLGVPIVGVGLLYQQGYFRQSINADGTQTAFYPYNDPGQLPIRPVRLPNGEWLRMRIDLADSPLWVRAWQVQVGSRRLYLMDTNDPANLPIHRGITSELYGGGLDLRLKQELVLGIAGWRLLRALKLEPEVCHLNEGHAAFAVLERAHCWMIDHQQPFEVALAVTRVGNVFTTHTPVEAGFDRFAPEVLGAHLRSYAETALRIDLEDLLALGRQHPHDEREPFNMAYLAVRGSGQINAVSRLHGEVSRGIFQPLFPRWPQPEVPISYVTNGVHTPTWVSSDAEQAWKSALGKDFSFGEGSIPKGALDGLSDADLWQMRTAGRSALIEELRERLPQQNAVQGASREEIEASGRLFDPAILTIGFARRFATYKRPNLLLHDPERLARILTNRQYPVQLLLAGKAHPQDQAGQAMIEQWSVFMRRPDVRPNAVFLQDYDMLLAGQMVQGVDLWINTPRRPWEACGTSGMKTLFNGGLNLSELDGWWAEAYTPEVGWALGDGAEHDDDPAWDAAEAEALYLLLEREVLPAFYTRDEHGLPPAWIARMRASMSRLAPVFAATRTIREYTEKHYIPAAKAFHEREARRGAAAIKLLSWKQHLRLHWKEIRFGSSSIETLEDGFTLASEVYFNGLHPDATRVELYAEATPQSGVFCEPMERAHSLTAENAYLYTIRVLSSRPPADFTPRIIPYAVQASVPLEADQILWQR